MAYMRVEYSQEVDVFIDGAQSGRTGELLLVEAGGHDIAIGDAASSICPPVQQVDLNDGDHGLTDPLVVTFAGGT